MIIKSSDFNNNDWIPDKCAGYGSDLSPEIVIEDLPENAVTLALTMDDLDHPIRPGFNHWLAWNIKPCNTIIGSISKGSIIEEPIHIEQGLAYGKNCYRGPKPPFNWKHRYKFTVYALDSKVYLSSDSKKVDLLNAIKGHVISEAYLIGIYQRKHK